MEAAIDPSRSRRLPPGPHRNSLGAQKRPHLLVCYRTLAASGLRLFHSTLSHDHCKRVSSASAHHSLRYVRTDQQQRRAI